MSDHGKRKSVEEVFRVTRNTHGEVYFVEHIKTLHIAGSFNRSFVPAAESRAEALCEELNSAELRAKS